MEFEAYERYFLDFKELIDVYLYPIEVIRELLKNVFDFGMIALDLDKEALEYIKKCYENGKKDFSIKNDIFKKL
jgi:hypothetical protein